MTNLLTDRLAEIRARVDAATEGPWAVNGPGEEWAVISSGPDSVIHAYAVHDDDCIGCECGRGAVEVALTIEDAGFIAHARTDLPVFLAAVAAFKEHCDRIIDEFEDPVYESNGYALGAAAAARTLMDIFTTAMDREPAHALEADCA